MTLYFLGVTPPAPIREQIESFRKAWGSPHHRVEPHVTVKAPFEYPGVPAPVLVAVRQVCAAARPLTMRLGQPGRFGGDRVLFLALTCEGLEDLHQQVLAAVSRFVPPRPGDREGGPYHPHLTLAASRFGIDAAGMAAMEAQARVKLAGIPPFSITSLRVYKKDRNMERWQPMEEIPLGTKGV